MGAVEATRFAQKPPSPEVLAAARTGTTIAANPAPAPGSGVASAPAQAQSNAVVEPMGQAKLAFDYTHLGEAGADYFSALVTGDLAKAAPALRRYLIP
jgi:hypothetical protein